MRRLRALLMALAASLVMTGCEFDVYELPLPGGTDAGADPITVTVQFRDVLDLVPQSTVKVNDVSVGKVTKVDLEGQIAEVTLELRRDTDLPDNALAEIRMTSLLGEKFVELGPPEEGASDNPLETGDEIPLERTGRNPEVEEVLGALSLLLNGGGVAQLKTITSELNLALEGREGAARSVLRQIELFMQQLDEGKGDIVDAIEALNRLSIAVNDQTSSIDLALEELPSALTSLDRQRGDLVKMLQALNRLGDVGVRVIKASKQSTIESFRQLAPVLTELANSGDNFANAFHVFLTYPFVDEVVGRDPQVARNLHMGDYTNLSVQLDTPLVVGPGGGGPTLPADECITLGEIPDTGPLPDLEDLCKRAANAINKCLENPSPENCEGLPGAVLQAVCAETPTDPLCGTVPDPAETPTRLERCLQKQDPDARACDKFTLRELQEACQKKRYRDEPLCRVLNPTGGGGGGLPTAVPSLSRPGFDARTSWFGPSPTMGELMEYYDPSLVSLLVPGMVVDR